MKPSVLHLAMAMSIIVVALALLIAEAISPAWYWCILWFVAQTQIVALLCSMRTHEIAAADLGNMLNTITSSMVHAVRCAGCHTAAVLARGDELGEVIDATGRASVPPGWQVIHERPYCKTCVAKGATNGADP